METTLTTNSRHLTTEMEEKSVDLFLELIGVSEYSYLYGSEKLRAELGRYIQKRFQRLGFCVLWFISLDDPTDDLSKILRRNGVIPKYEKFSMIVDESTIRLSPKFSFDCRKIYEAKKPKPKRKNVSYSY